MCDVLSYLLTNALADARETRQVEIGSGTLAAVPGILRAHFGSRPAAVIADRSTLAAAGMQVLEALRQARHEALDPFVFDDDSLHAEERHVQRLQEWLARHGDAVPVAVGAGTINDMTKLAAHRAGGQYLCVPTAASMDGYSAFGASVVARGAKQMFECPAPPVIVADLEVVRSAPASLNAAGYADLLAKITAGADWILADALGEEPIDPAAWELVRSSVLEALSDPTDICSASRRALRGLLQGLIMSGLAMQRTRTSRPASGAEHHFSHLWDMQHHTHAGQIPLHGFKVGIGTLAIASLYEYLLTLPLESLDVEQAIARWPDESQVELAITRLFENDDVARKAREETAAKYVGRDRVAGQLQQLRECWPELSSRLRKHLLPVEELRRLLASAGAPVEPEQIGIPRERLRQTLRQACFIRRRFTVLDLVMRAGLLDQCVEHLFATSPGRPGWQQRGR
jgi:glycerol-1-phosphate dehydrogenase [NAD(P)+]